VAATTQEALDDFYPGLFAAAMTRIGQKKRGWPPMTRARFEAQTGTKRRFAGRKRGKKWRQKDFSGISEAPWRHYPAHVTDGYGPKYRMKSLMQSIALIGNTLKTIG